MSFDLSTTTDRTPVPGLIVVRFVRDTDHCYAQSLIEEITGLRVRVYESVVVLNIGFRKQSVEDGILARFRENPSVFSAHHKI